MKSRRRALLVMATVAAALLPGAPAAQAALTWTAPGILTPKESDSENPRVAIDGGGNALAVWTTIKPLPFDRVDIQVQGAQRPAGGNFQLLTEPIIRSDWPVGGVYALRPPRVAMNARGDAIVVSSYHAGSFGYITADFIPAGGAPSSGDWLIERIGDCGGDAAFDPQPEVAIDERGDALVVWNNETTVGGGACFPPGDQIWARRLANLGRDLQPPVQISSEAGAKGHPHVAFDPQGNALALWQAPGGIRAATNAASAVAWDAQTTVSNDGGVYPFVSFDTLGNAIATWQSPGENVVKAALRPAGQGFSGLGSPFTGVLDLGIAPRAALDPLGNALASRLHWDGARYVAEAAYRPAGGAFTPTPLGQSRRDDPVAETLPDDTPRADLDSMGNAVVAWRSWDGAVERVQASERPPGALGSFSSRPISDYPPGYTCPSEEASECPSGDFFGTADLAVNENGDAVAVWARSDGQNQRALATFGVPPGQPLPPPPPPPPPPPNPSAIQPARKMQRGEAVVLRADVSGAVDRLEWDFSFRNPRIVGTVADGALQRSVRFRPPAGKRFTVTVKAIGPGGSDSFTRSFTAPRAPEDVQADRVRRALSRTDDAPVFAVGTPDVLTGRSGSCGPVTVISAQLELDGCMRPVDALADIPGAERGVLDPLARELNLDRAEAELMRRAVELTDGYVARARTAINGRWPVVPGAGADVVAFTQAQVLASSNAAIQVGGIRFGQGPGGFNLKIDPRRRDIPLGTLPRPPSLPKIGGFPLVGDFDVKIEGFEARITASLRLPSFLKRAGVDIQNQIKLRANPDEIIIDELTIGPIKVHIGALGVDDFKIAYTRAGDEWNGQGRACVIGSACLDMIPPNGGVRIKDGRLDFAGASLGFPAPGIPLWAGVNLERIGFGFGLGPTRFTGNARLAFAHLLVIDGRLVLAFPTADTPFFLRREEVGNDFPAKLYTYRYTGTTMGLSAGAALRLPAVGEVPLAQAYVLYEYPGYLALGGGMSYGFKEPLTGVTLIGVTGRVDGEFNATNGRFNVDGHVEGCVVEIICKGFDGNVSNQGMAVCAKVSAVLHEFHAGGAIRWSPFKFIPYLDGCKWGRFREPNVRGARAAQAGGPYTVEIGRDEPSRMIMLDAAEGAPRVRVSGPGAQDFESPEGSELGLSPDGRFRILRSDEHKFVAVALVDPRPGTYTITPLPGSPPVSHVREAKALPGPSVRGAVSGRGARRVLTYSVRRRADQAVTFFDVAASGSGKQIGRVAGGGRGRLAFSPAPGRGRHRVEARFELDGVPAERRVIARFKPPSPRLGTPKRLDVRRRPKAVIVRWARVRGATRYEVALTPSRGRQRFVTTSRGSLVLRRVPKTVRGTVSVRAVDRLRQGRAAKKRFARAARPKRNVGSLPRCKVKQRRVSCRRR